VVVRLTDRLEYVKRDEYTTRSLHSSASRTTPVAASEVTSTASQHIVDGTGVQEKSTGRTHGYTERRGMHMPIESMNVCRKRSAVFFESVDAWRRCWKLVHVNIRFHCAFEEAQTSRAGTGRQLRANGRTASMQMNGVETSTSVTCLYRLVQSLEPTLACSKQGWLKEGQTSRNRVLAKHYAKAYTLSHGGPMYMFASRLIGSTSSVSFIICMIGTARTLHVEHSVSIGKDSQVPSQKRGTEE
jgi:hypothetical protein